jgi:hypothetical protein
MQWGSSNPNAMMMADHGEPRVVPISAPLDCEPAKKTFTFLCIHGVLHVWNRLKWLADINALLAVRPEGSERFIARHERGSPSGIRHLALPQGRSVWPILDLIDTLRQSWRVRWLKRPPENLYSGAWN